MDKIITGSEPDQDEEIVILGDAAALTKGNTSSSVESKQTPYS